jgi:diguanylate cyclase
MSGFLLDNDLDVSPANLVLAHGIFSGANPRLARQVTARSHSGVRVTQAWLDEVAAHDNPEQNDPDLEKFTARLESTLEAFYRSTKAARHATASYNSELEHHVAELGQVADTGAIVTSLADLAKAMLDHTRKAESEMRHSENEAALLRKKLATARRDAEVDHLTGLPNRRAFEALLDQQYAQAQAAIEPLCVAFCDIDHFKRVNDTHGHDAGDRVIQAIAEALVEITNQNCHVARHGGEEFVMLFRGIALGEAKKRLDETRERLADRRLINRESDKPFGQITFSGGIANVFGYENPRVALKAADEALYRAKEQGRNQILIAG